MEYLLGLLLVIFYFLNFFPSKAPIKEPTNSWLQDKYGLSDQEAFIYNIIPDEIKREEYLRDILRKKIN